MRHFSLIVKMVRQKRLPFYWRAEDWIKDPAAWEASYGSSLLEKLTVCEAKRGRNY